MAYELPVADGQPGATLVADGLVYKGEKIPFDAIALFKCSDDEVEVIFKPEGDAEPRESLIFVIQEGCSHQLPDMRIMIETHMMQKGTAVMSPDRETVINAPKFDTKRVRKTLGSSLAYG